MRDAFQEFLVIVGVIGFGIGWYLGEAYVVPWLLARLAGL